MSNIRNEIIEKVKEYYAEEFIKDKFIPGKTKINYAGRFFNEKELINLIDASLDFWLTYGKYTELFENKLAQFIGMNYSFFVNSGSSANLMAITALTSFDLKEKRLKPGDEVITIAAGFPTTVTPIIQNRLVPVFLDIELDTYNIDLNNLEKALSKKTKAVFLAHTLGNPFNLNRVKKFCDNNGLWLIEDNCDSLGSKYNNKLTGSFGDISTCSFYPAHHITTGEGGAVLTNNHKIAKILRSLRDWGRDCWCPSGKDNTCGTRFDKQYGLLSLGYDHKYVYSHLGFNLKATDLQAAIGLAQLEKLADIIKARKRNHELLFTRLEDLQNIIILPKAQKDSEPSWFGFLITLVDSKIYKRNNIIKNLEKFNIQTRLLFAGNIIKQPMFDNIKINKEYRIVGNLKNTDKVMNDSFWIGVYPGINEEIIDYMSEIIHNFFNNNY